MKYRAAFSWPQQLLLVDAFLLLFVILSAAEPVAGTALPPQDQHPIKIGLLVNADTARDLRSRQAADVVQLVVDQVNASGGIRDRKIELVVQSVEGNWGAGSKRSVDLISEQEVSAILGFLDGRSAHLVEQVCTKARVPFLSTLTPDPTLSRSNIPWYFSTMPHAGQQAETLADEIYTVRKGGKVSIVASDAYDQRYLVRAFRRVTEHKGYRSPTLLTYRSGTTDFREISSRLAASGTGIVVFFGSTTEWNAWLTRLVDTGIRVPHYLPIMETGVEMVSRTSFPVFGVRSNQWQTDEEKKFREQFQNRFAYRPGKNTIYIYDGVVALLKSIRMQGSSSTAIQQGLRKVNVQGITGPLSFDDSGVKKGELVVVRVN